MLKWNYLCNVSKFWLILLCLVVICKVFYDVNSVILKMFGKKIKCKIIVIINSIKLGVFFVKIYICYDVFY